MSRENSGINQIKIVNNVVITVIVNIGINLIVHMIIVLINVKAMKQNN